MRSSAIPYNASYANMRTYRVIPHTSDIRLRVRADTLEELFAAALEGMAEIMQPKFCKKQPSHTTRYHLAVNADNPTLLLIDFLSEVLTRAHIDRVVYCRTEFATFAPTSFSATVSGSRTETFAEDIKAVTYHEADVRQDITGAWQTTIIFDI